MASKHLYDLAFAYKKTRLWKKMDDTELFAIALPDGETGYCSVMGDMGEHIALALYVGQAGLDSYRKLVLGVNLMDELDPSTMLSQNCLQCAFESREALSDEEAAAVRSYTRANGITLRGPHAWPQFLKYVPRRYPWHIQEETDWAYMEEALSAAIALSAILDGNRRRDLGFVPILDDTPAAIPLVVRQNGEYVLLRTDLPEAAPEEWPAPPAPERKTVDKLRKLKKKGIYQCGILWLPGFIEESGEDQGPPQLACMLLCVDSRRHFILPVEPVLGFSDHPELLIQSLTESLLREKTCPSAMKVRDEETRALLENFCAAVGVLLSLDEHLPVLDDVRENLIHSIMNSYEDEDEDTDDDELDAESLEWLMDLTDEEIRNLPAPLAESLAFMAEHGILPETLGWRVLRALRR